MGQDWQETRANTKNENYAHSLQINNTIRKNDEWRYAEGQIMLRLSDLLPIKDKITILTEINYF